MLFSILKEQTDMNHNKGRIPLQEEFHSNFPKQQKTVKPSTNGRKNYLRPKEPVNIKIPKRLRNQSITQNSRRNDTLGINLLSNRKLHPWLLSYDPLGLGSLIPSGTHVRICSFFHKRTQSPK
jgi:hypothetical protein